MITLPQLITTDTDVTTGLQASKTADSAQDFLALLAGALGAGDAQGKDAPLSLADLQAAGGKLQKGLLQKNGDTPQATALADLLARQDLLTDDATADLTDAQQLLSTLTPSLKSNALNALSKTARQDDNAPALSDEDLANLSALFAMLPGQPALTPTTRTASAEGALSAPASLRGDTRAAMQDAVAGLTTGELKKGKVDAAPGVTANSASNQPVTPLVAAAAAKADMESTPSPVTTIGAMTTPGGMTTQTQPAPVAAAPVLSAPLGSHEWQQSLSQHVTLFTRQGQQSAELRLHPEELGQIQISLKMDDNQAQLQMVSAHSHVRAALEAALPVLRTQLAENGIQLGQSSISSESFAGQQQSSSQQQHASRAQGQEAFAAEDDIALTTPGSLQAAARGDGAVDIFA